MTRTPDGSMNSAVDGTAEVSSTGSVTPQPTSRRAARELERQQERAAARRPFAQRAASLHMVSAAPAQPGPAVSATSVSASSVAAPSVSARSVSARSTSEAEPADVATAVDETAAVPSIRRAPISFRTIAPAKAPTVVQTSRRAATRANKPLGRRILKQTTSAAAMLGVAAMLVSTTIGGLPFAPLESAEADQTAAGSAELKVPAQSLGVVAATNAEAGTVVRESFEAKKFVPTPAPQPQVRWTTQATGGSFLYTNNPSGSIQWPFVHPAPITYGFGPRNACSFCSTFHLGVDFTPGAGVPVQAITEGVVSSVRLDSGGLGNHVVIDHVVNGQRIQSIYAHLAWGSIQVAVGQQVSVGTVVGAVGSTGASTGAHLHLEIHADGTPIDPFAWLQANAN